MRTHISVSACAQECHLGNLSLVIQDRFDQRDANCLRLAVALVDAKPKLNALAKREVINSRRDDVADVKEVLLRATVLGDEARSSRSNVFTFPNFLSSVITRSSVNARKELC